MKRFIVFLFSFGSIFFLFPTSVDAIDFTVSEVNVSRNELNVKASMNGVTSTNCPNSKCYLLGVLRVAGGSFYFGETQNNSGVWIDYLSSYEKDYILDNFYVANIKEASWSGELKVRYKNDNVNYKGPGDYELKLRRYTGGSTNFAGEAFFTVKLDQPLPTPTATATPLETQTPTPSLVPTLSQTATPRPLKTNTPTPKSTQAPESTKTPEGIISPEVLGIESGETPLPSPEVKEFTKKKIPIFAYVFISLGLIILVFGGYILFFRAKEEYTSTSGETKSEQ